MFEDICVCWAEWRVEISGAVHENCEDSVTADCPKPVQPIANFVRVLFSVILVTTILVHTQPAPRTVCDRKFFLWGGVCVRG